ncbi:MAG: TIGR02757 family protein [Bacteroidetes bacterium]|nr:TIGR02757 family protein [Bacteroidota bacterium]
MFKDLPSYLESCVERYNRPSFIDNDPVQIPHRFGKLQDREIMGFWTAMLAWGQRKTIINKSLELIELMDGVPHDFMVNHQETDRKRFLNFKHRTFQATDTLYFLEFFQQYYRKHHSLETAFAEHLTEMPDGSLPQTVEKALIGFHETFFSLDVAPQRTRKHVATPIRKSTCKRLNMFLRWMVRSDDKGVDFGVWNQIRPAQLLLPLDVHVDRVARKFGLIKRKQTDWLTVLELTDYCRSLDPTDPAKYDYALFGLSVEGEI